VIRVLLVDDDRLVRAGLRTLLDAEEDLEVVGEAADGDAAIRLNLALAPDVVLMDVRMPGMGGIEATQRLVARDPERPRVVVLTTFEQDEFVHGALRAGASGFLLKRVDPDELVAAVRLAARGESLLLPRLTRALVARHRPLSPDPAVAARLAELTPREREVLRLVAAGRSNAEIAGALVVATETVKSHVAGVLLKLGARDRTQAAISAYEGGLVRPGEA
jgi:DNA-binding NarL/FixJ family response regulator